MKTKKLFNSLIDPRTYQKFSKNEKEEEKKSKWKHVYISRTLDAWIENLDENAAIRLDANLSKKSFYINQGDITGFSMFWLDKKGYNITKKHDLIIDKE